jgi:CheY-like chemotaxis protein
MKLLIVDDHPGMRAMIRELAAQPGDTVCECADGEGALKVVQEFSPDVITMDVRLPGLGGLEATRVLRASLPHTHIVVVTAYDQPAVRHVARHSGASGFIAKDHLEQLRPLLAHYRAFGERSPTGATRPASIVWKHSA